jgi:hypothetical protein
MAVLCLSDVEPWFFFNYLSNVKPAYIYVYCLMFGSDR